MTVVAPFIAWLLLERAIDVMHGKEELRGSIWLRWMPGNEIVTDILGVLMSFVAASYLAIRLFSESVFPRRRLSQLARAIVFLSCLAAGAAWSLDLYAALST